MVETLKGLALRLTIGSVFTIIQYPTSQATEPSQARAPLPPVHPSSASARRKRLGWWLKAREDTAVDLHEILTPIRLPFSVSGLAISGLVTTGALFSSRPLISRAEVPLEFEADTVLLRVTITRNRRGTILTAVAHDASSKTPVQGIELTLVPAQDIPITAKTNRQGTARFRLPIGESDLLI